MVLKHSIYRTNTGRIPVRQIRADYCDDRIRVYQAFSPVIADAALSAGKFTPPHFNFDRMTWIKPSFLWMMYRSNWATRRNQERVLRIEIRRRGFEWALANSCLSHYEKRTYRDKEHWQTLLRSLPVRIQWDPERDIDLSRLQYRSIQIGLSGEAVQKYVHEWIYEICDLTGLAREIQSLVSNGEKERATELLPKEEPYPLSRALQKAVGIIEESL